MSALDNQGAFIMEEWQEELIELRETLEEIAKIEKKRKKIDIIGKTISLKNQLNVCGRKLKLKNRTAKDIKNHVLLLNAVNLLFNVEDINSPMALLGREIELLLQVQDGLRRAVNDIIVELKAENSSVEHISVE